MSGPALFVAWVRVRACLCGAVRSKARGQVGGGGARYRAFIVALLGNSHALKLLALGGVSRYLLSAAHQKTAVLPLSKTPSNKSSGRLSIFLASPITSDIIHAARAKRNEAHMVVTLMSVASPRRAATAWWLT